MFRILKISRNRIFSIIIYPYTAFWTHKHIRIRICIIPPVVFFRGNCEKSRTAIRSAVHLIILIRCAANKNPYPTLRLNAFFCFHDKGFFMNSRRKIFLYINIRCNSFSGLNLIPNFHWKPSLKRIIKRLKCKIIQF